MRPIMSQANAKDAAPTRSVIRTIAFMAFLVLGPLGTAKADYLIVSRPATLKAEASGDAAILERLTRGDRLELIAPDQVAGYYFAKNAQTGTQGYIYRTLAQRYDSEDTGLVILPSDPSSDAVQLLTTAFFDSRETDMYAHFISVGQANATLLEFPCGAILIDAGHYTSRLRDSLIGYLDAFFASRLDLDRTFNAVFITHNQGDHTGGLREICENYRVLNSIDNGQDSTKTQAEIREDFAAMANPPKVRGINWTNIRTAAGHNGMTDAVIDPADCGTFDPTIRVLSGSFDSRPSGWSSSAYKNLNNHSLVIRVDYRQSSLLFTGDLEEEGIEQLLAQYAGTSALDVDVYEVGHHGSPHATTPKLLGALTPDIAVFSAGSPDDRGGGTAFDYGHPRQSAIQLLCDSLRLARVPAVIRRVAQESDVEFVLMPVDKLLFGTAWDGDVVIKFKLDGTIQIAVARREVVLLEHPIRSLTQR